MCAHGIHNVDPVACVQHFVQIGNILKNYGSRAKSRMATKKAATRKRKEIADNKASDRVNVRGGKRSKRL